MQVVGCFDLHSADVLDIMTLDITESSQDFLCQGCEVKRLHRQPITKTDTCWNQHTVCQVLHRIRSSYVAATDVDSRPKIAILGVSGYGRFTTLRRSRTIAISLMPSQDAVEYVPNRHAHAMGRLTGDCGTAERSIRRQPSGVLSGRMEKASVYSMSAVESSSVISPFTWGLPWNSPMNRTFLIALARMRESLRIPF